jgi:hypothetical protein
MDFFDHMRLKSYQGDFAANTVRFKIGLWAPQTGKDHTATAEVVVDCLENPGATWIIVAASERQARIHGGSSLSKSALPDFDGIDMPGIPRVSLTSQFSGVRSGLERF